jgi:RHS repeat-associated protein
VIWPAKGDPSANLQTTVFVGGEPWVFYPQVQNPAMPSTAAAWITLMTNRGVALHTPGPSDPAPSPWLIDGVGTFHYTVAPSSDGTKFLVSFGYTTPVEQSVLGVVTHSTLDLGKGFAILDGPNATWVQFPDQTYPVVAGQTKDWISHFTNSWGDHVTADETYTRRVNGDGTANCWSLEKIVLADQNTSASITLQVQFSGSPTRTTSSYDPGDGSSVNYISLLRSSQATILVTSSIGGVSLPQVTLSGWWLGRVRQSILPAPECPGYDVNAHPVPVGVYDWAFFPSTISAQASNGSRTTALTWPVQNDLVDGPVTNVTLPSGLTEAFTHLETSSLSQFSFSPCNGYWTGFSVTLPYTTPASSMRVYVNDDFIAGGGSGGRITLSDPSGPGQTILISRLYPSWTGIGGGGFMTIHLDESEHVTTVLRYASSAPDGNTPFRGIRLTHPSFQDGVDYTGIQGYLFATSAIIKEEAITGTGIPSGTNTLDSPGGWQPSSPDVYRTTVYDGFDLHSWANPSGALGTSLPVTAIARRTSVFTPDLPTKVTLAGDPGDPTACDDRGPVRTDEWTGPVQSAPDVSTVLAQTASSSQVSGSNSALSSAIRRKGLITRHFDWSLLRLLTDTDQKSLDGDSTLQALRGVPSVDFGTTQYFYNDPQSLGRISSVVGSRGGFVATETRSYNGTLPQIADTTKTLTQNGTTLYANPGNHAVVVGEHRTFDTTYYQWPQTETDKVDGRPDTINTRDGVGRVTKETNPAGVVTDTTYNPWGQVETVTREAKGGVGAVVSTTTYDPGGRWRDELVTSDGRPFTTHTEMDAFGRVTKVTGPDGSTQQFFYDGFGQKIAQSPVIKPGMTSWGNETWAYDPQGRVTDHWDTQGRLLMHVVQQPTWQVINGVAGIWTESWGDRHSATFPDTRYEAVDLLGQKIAVIDQKGQMSTYAYDADGHLTTTHQGGQIRAYTYNAIGWLTSRTEPEEGTTWYSTDSNGQPLTGDQGFTMLGTPLLTIQTGRSGVRNTTFSTTLDAHLQPSQITASGPEGVVTRTLSYDYGASNTHLLSHLLEIQAISGLPVQAESEGYGYDALGRLLSKVVSDGDDGYTGNTPTFTQSFAVSQTLNDGGQVTSLTYPAGGGKAAQTATIQYDSLNRPQTVQLDGALRGMMTYGPGAGASITDTLILGNGVQTLATTAMGELLDSRFLLPQQTAAPTGIIDHPMSWTAGGLMLSRGADTFDYDELQRLNHSKVVGVFGETEEQWFHYDRYGNRDQSNFLYTPATGSTQPSEALAWQAAYVNGNDLPATVAAMSPGDLATSTTTGTNLSTGVLYDDLGRMAQVWTTPGQASTLTTWVYDPSGRVMEENGTTYLLESSGLRFKRTKADGTVDYTVYGFNREPLAQFEIPAAGGTQSAQTQSTQTTTTKFSSKTQVSMQSGNLPQGPTGAYILQPSGPITVAPGQIVSFQGATDDGTTFTWTYGDGHTDPGLSATHAFSAVGIYNVSFKATATGYTASTAMVTITVKAKPSITSFTASPASITSGDTSTLAWTTTGADTLTLDNGIGTVTGTSRGVTPAVSTTYTLTATNAAGSVTATVTVAVSAPAAPTITSFTASPSTIARNSSTTLAWSVTGGAAVSISGLGAQGGTSVSVAPTQTMSYTLTATNAAGSATATITVTVETDLPVIADFWSDPVQIQSGDSATLNWAVGRMDSLSLDNGIGTVTGASRTVSPTTTTTYRLTATNLIGSVSATVTVSVGSPGSLVWKKTMVYGFGQELAEDQPGMGTTFIQGDFVGSPSVMTDANGIVIGRSKNLPFGERMSSWGQKTVRRYTNHEDDSDSNAIYMQAREYLPAYGKFAQVDPAYDQTKDDPETWNLYNYVTNNPVTHTDPDGRIDKQTGGPSPIQLQMMEDTGMCISGDTMYVWSDSDLGGGSTSEAQATMPSAGDGTSAGSGTQISSNGTAATGTSQPEEGKAPSVTTGAGTGGSFSFTLDTSFTPMIYDGLTPLDPSWRQVSQAGQDFIKGYEKLSLTVYDASKGKVKGGDWTIGYGHKTTKDAGPIKLPEAEALFKSDVARMESHVAADLDVPVTQIQFDALVSLRFNSGPNVITPPVADLNRTGHATMGDFTNHYITAGGKPMKGLELRRAAEWVIFDEGVYDASH